MSRPVILQLLKSLSQKHSQANSNIKTSLNNGQSSNVFVYMNEPMAGATSKIIHAAVSWRMPAPLRNQKLGVSEDSAKRDP